MKDQFGTNLSLTLYGESHGPAIGIVLNGLPAGIPIDEARIQKEMDRRKAKGRLSTQRHEADQVKILSGIWNGHTTGTAICMQIANQEQKSQDYEALKYRLRPGHADYTAWLKYQGFQDYRGGGHFSGRLTAPIVAAGAIARQVLEQKGIRFFSHLEQVLDFKDKVTEAEQIENIKDEELAIVNEEIREKVKERLTQLANAGDSAGAIVETFILNPPQGIGEPFFDSVESVLSHLLFSIPAVKGVSFGQGFAFATMTGSQANDAYEAKEKTIHTKTNHNGGINGGIANGSPIHIHTVIKPTPSIYKEQDSVDYQTKENVKLQIQGRHDPFIAQRAIPVIEAMAAIGLLELMMAESAGTVCK